MRPTDLTLMEQLRITPLELSRRKEYMRITDEDVRTMRELKPTIAEAVDDIVAEHYEKILAHDEVSRLIGDSESVYRLKQHLRKYILDLFDGSYDEDYVHSRLRVGMVHKRIGVTPQLYVGAMELLRCILQRKIVEALGEDCPLCRKSGCTLTRVLMFDLSLVFDMYIHSLMEAVSRSKEELESHAASLQQQVVDQTQQLAELACRDGLTSLHNRRSFYEELRRELARSQRRALTLTLIYFDLDDFKTLNDTQGHHRGDEALLAVSRSLEDVLRTSDIPARLGGDEFCVLLPETTTEQAEGTCARIEKAMAASLEDMDITCSMGIASTGPETFLDANSLVKAADGAMYKAKKVKGYAVCIAEEKTARSPRPSRKARSTSEAGVAG